MFENLQFNKVTQNLSFDVKTEGLPIYNAIFNGLRRILITDLPIIGFLFDSDESTIDIEENYTAYNIETCLKIYSLTKGYCSRYLYISF